MLFSTIAVKLRLLMPKINKKTKKQNKTKLEIRKVYSPVSFS